MARSIILAVTLVLAAVVCLSAVSVDGAAPPTKTQLRAELKKLSATITKKYPKYAKYSAQVNKVINVALNSKYDFSALKNSTLLLMNDAVADALAKRFKGKKISTDTAYNLTAVQIIATRFTQTQLQAITRGQLLRTQLKGLSLVKMSPKGPNIMLGQRPSVPSFPPLHSLLSPPCFSSFPPLLPLLPAPPDSPPFRPCFPSFPPLASPPFPPCVPSFPPFASPPFRPCIPSFSPPCFPSFSPPCFPSSPPPTDSPPFRPCIPSFPPLASPPFPPLLLLLSPFASPPFPPCIPSFSPPCFPSFPPLASPPFPHCIPPFPPASTSFPPDLRSLLPTLPSDLSCLTRHLMSLPSQHLDVPHHLPSSPSLFQSLPSYPPSRPFHLPANTPVKTLAYALQVVQALAGCEAR
ncbi:unnamed protein product [Closterium sp. NIES-64]|nr:unnamed protein product [Closterium sp. NIES-65]CAI6000780.1 unnamed protein product [Closterium sp. NIES-64]